MRQTRRDRRADMWVCQAGMWCGALTTLIQRSSTAGRRNSSSSPKQQPPSIALNRHPVLAFASGRNKAITPGVTPTEDVEWWIRDKMQTLDYTTFKPGDITHCDFGVTAMGLNTDTQHLDYVLGPGETGSGIPQSVLVGMDLAYWLQETTRKHMKIGMTENDRLQNICADMQQKGDQDKIYCHAVGEFGHSAGTATGTHVQLTIKLFCLSSWAKYVSADNFCAHGRNDKSSRRGPLPG